MLCGIGLPCHFVLVWFGLVFFFWVFFFSIGLFFFFRVASYQNFYPRGSYTFTLWTTQRGWWETDVSTRGFPITSLLSILISSWEHSHCQHICVGLCCKHTLSWIPIRLQRRHLMSHLMFIRPRETACLQFSVILPVCKPENRFC